jgi:hypothetical protein
MVAGKRSVRTSIQVEERVSVRGMDKKEINSTKLTLNFLFWIGGVFMLLLFALLGHFVWRIF